MLQRRGHLNLDLRIRIHLLRNLEGRLQRLRRKNRVIGLLTFLFPILCLLPFLYLLGQFPLTLGIRCLCQCIESIGLTDEVTKRIRHHIGHLHAQGILIDQGCIAQPIMDGVLLFLGLDDEGTISIKVQAFDDRQIRMAIGEVHTDLLGLLAFRLQQITVCLDRGKGQQRNVIGQEMRIRRLFQGINMQRITPDRIYPYIGLRRRCISLMVKADHLTPLTQAEITIGILQRIGAVGTRGNALNDKTASAIST